MGFAHLHTHTEYSLLDGSNKITEYVARVKELGMNSAAITDHGVMYGVIDFYRAAKNAGIKPIIGCEVYVATGSRFSRDASEGEDRYHHLVLLAETNEGYANLVKIVSKGFVDGFYYKPRVDKEILEQYHTGIIALSACLAGEIPRLLVKGRYEEAKEAALWYRDTFGENNYFLELQDHGIREQQLVNSQLLRMSQETGIELVATNDIHYTYREDEQAHDILLCIQTGKLLSDENRMRYEGGQYYVKSEEEMKELFSYAPAAIENTQKIADRCDVEIVFGERKLPKYDVPKGFSAWEYLNKLCNEGIERRYSPVTDELRQRLEYELNTIHSMGFVDYFLIVWDFIKYAKDHDIMVGPGRGSAAGSIVAYCLGITDIDPIKYNLLFERFLNPERVSMPDIDVDFCFERRQEVIDYVVRKYGKDRVVQIVTFGTLQAKGVIRDVGRVMDLPYAFVDSIAKMIPRDLGMTIDKALSINRELKQAYETDEQIKYLIDMSKKLEGLPRHSSMHAAGVVISQKSVDEYVPLSRASDGSITTQFTMTTLEELGLLKMDFLGLRTLTVIQNAVRMAEKRNGIKLDMSNIDYNDKEVLEMISSGKTDGVFQLESGGMKGFMRELQPQNLEDIIAGISLYRPGPMDFIPQYIKGKENGDNITYMVPQLEPILSPTYGCIVYQEQVMQIVRDLAGYTLGRSDLVRRAMSKKKTAVMEKERQNFIYGNEQENVPGCIKNGISEKDANRIYDSMIEFAKYAFNKSHAAAYAVVSYQTAYLKYYYPVEFMAALMTSVMENPTKEVDYIQAARSMGIELLPPSLNEGESGFSVTDKGIMYGLSAIKSVGKSVIDLIIEERKLNGTFVSLKDFIQRTNGKEVNKRAIESFIKAGATDCFDGNRHQKMIIYSTIMDSIQQEKKNNLAGQMSLFDMMGEQEKKDYEIKLPNVEEYSKQELLVYEKEVLGIYVSGHPLKEYEECWKKNITAKTTDFLLNEETGEIALKDKQEVTIGGMITDVRTMLTKKNQMMAFLMLEDLYGTAEVVIFPQSFEKYKHILKEDEKVFIKGRVDASEDRDGKILAQDIIRFEDIPKELWIQFPNKEKYVEEESNIYSMLNEDGVDKVVIYVTDIKAIKRLNDKRISISDKLLQNLRGRYGKSNVKVVEKTIEKQ